MKKVGSLRTSALLVGALVLGSFSPVDALQAPPTDTVVHELASLVVTANRAPSLLESSTASVSVLRGAELERLSEAGGLASALHSVPGFAFLPFDGSGYDPKATVRGFYGGGEVEYVLVLLDGQPLSDLETGLIDWNRVPRENVESVEILRGGASSLYGDAALGGVINIITRTGDVAAPTDVTATLAASSYASFDGSLGVSGGVTGRPFTVATDVRTTGGFRRHAGRTLGGVSGSIGLVQTDSRVITVSTQHRWRSLDDPGPLAQDRIDFSRTQVSPFFLFDHLDERNHRLALNARIDVGRQALFSAALAGELRGVERVRTLPLTPDFADTKERQLDTRRLTASAQLTTSSLLGDRDRLVVGVDASVGSLGAQYFAFASGGADDYAAAVGRRGDLDAAGGGRRAAAAGFFQYEFLSTRRARLSVGGRADVILDAFEPRTPSQGGRTTTDHAAFSPKAGLNVTYTESDRHTGHWYVNVARSFKAPTLDQLYDQRSTPVPFPPFSITTANDGLDPQTGTSLETGIYHRVTPSRSDLSGELSLSVYDMDMKDEIDFDLQTFRFVNITESRHRGVEAGLKFHKGARASAYLNYTLQDVTSRVGDFEGKQLKAVPKHHWTGGLSGGLIGALEGAAFFTSTRTMYLNDANSERIPDYTTVDVRLSHQVAGGTLSFEVANVFDEEYQATGFPDPAGSDVRFFYPAAGRTSRLVFTTTLRGGSK